MTDLLKAALEKFAGFVAPVIPGATVLILFGIHHPEWAITIRDITYLGYQTKLSLILVSALVSGWTVVTAYGALFGFVHGALSPALLRWLKGEKQEHPPWRNKTWRALVMTYLGSAAPEDLDLVSDEVLALQVEAANLLPNPLERAQAIAKAKDTQGRAAVVEYYWESWWHTLHQDVLQDKDPVTQLTLTLQVNLQAASVVLLCAMPSTPILRHWWVISPCVFWLVMGVMTVYAYLRQLRDPWSSFTKQMDYLRSQMPSAKAKGQASGDSH
jgi:hypothetical protein